MVRLQFIQDVAFLGVLIGYVNDWISLYVIFCLGSRVDSLKTYVIDTDESALQGEFVLLAVI